MINPTEIQITIWDNQASSSVIKWLFLTQNVTPQTLDINNVYGAHSQNHIGLKTRSNIIKEKIQAHKLKDAGWSYFLVSRVSSDVASDGFVKGVLHGRQSGKGEERQYRFGKDALEDEDGFLPLNPEGLRTQ